MRYHQAMLVSCEVPWDLQEHFLEEMFRFEVQRNLDRGFHDLYIFGTAGEGYAVDTETFRRVAEVFFEETSRKEARPQVGVIGLSTAAVRERIAIAYGIGFRTFQISLPCWGALNDQELLRFFRDTWLSFPDCRFLHYNLLRTKRLLCGSDYRRIANEVPNLVATKNTGTTVLSTADLMRKAPELQHFFGEAMFPTACLFGECSLLSSFAPMFPEPSRRLFELGITGQFDKLFPYQRDYLTAVEEIIAPLRRQPLMDGAYDKVLVRLGGGEMPLRLLSPYEGFTEKVFEECRHILESGYSEWLR